MEGTKEKRITCLLCSSVYSDDGEQKQSKETDGGGSQDLTNIYKLIVKTKCAPSNNLHGDEERGAELQGEGTSKSNTALEESMLDEVFPEALLLEETLKDLERDKYSVCSSCNSITVAALESRCRADNMEVEVRNLQRQLLELLRKLQEEMEVYSQEMTKMELMVKKADDPMCMGAEHQHGEGEGKTHIVRERILEVVTDLRFFQSDLNDKLVILSRAVDNEDHRKEVEPAVDVSFVPESEEEVEVVTCDASLIEEDSAEDADGEQDHGQEEINMEYGNYMGHYILGGGVHECVTEGVRHELEGHSDIMDSTNSDGYMESSSSFNDDLLNSHHNYAPRTSSPKKKSKAKPAKFKGVNLARVTAFKKGLIKRAMEREMKRNQADDYHENPLIRYFLRYDPPTDSFYVGHIQVRLQDRCAVNHGSNSASEAKLECTGFGCDARWTPPANSEHTTTFDRDVRNHVIGKHLGGFSCRVCSLILDSYFKLMQHFKKQHPGQKPLNDEDNKVSKSPRRRQQFQQYFYSAPTMTTPTTSSSSCIPNGMNNGISHYFPPQNPPPSIPNARFKSLERYRKKPPKRLTPKRDQLVRNELLQVPLSPSEGLKQVRITMRSAIESLGEPSTSNSASPHILNPPSSLHVHDDLLILHDQQEPPKKRGRRSYNKPKVKV